MTHTAYTHLHLHTTYVSFPGTVRAVPLVLLVYLAFSMLLLWRLYSTNLTALFTTKHHYTYGNVLPSFAPIMYRKPHRVILNSTPTRNVFLQNSGFNSKKTKDRS